MSANPVQVEQYQDFTGLDEYQFSGDSVTVSNKRGFLAAYRTQASIFHAAAIAGISRMSFYRYLERDPVFAAAFEDCKQDAVDTVETSVFHDAVHGNNPLLKMFYLKAHRPIYRDRMTIDVEELREQVRDRMQSLPVSASETLQLNTSETLQLPQISPPSEQIEKE